MRRKRCPTLRWILQRQWLRQAPSASGSRLAGYYRICPGCGNTYGRGTNPSGLATHGPCDGFYGSVDRYDRQRQRGWPTFPLRPAPTRAEVRRLQAAQMDRLKHTA